MIVKISGAKGPSYVYYRLYTKHAALEPINPLCYDYRFISRVSSKSVTPPHTAASLKRHLCSCEGFKATEKCDLYRSLFEKTPVEDSTRIQLRGTNGPGPGISESQPMALVIDAEKRLSGKSMIAQVAAPKWQGKQRHIHYRVYNESGETASTRSFNENDVSLGRVNVLRVPLPHTAASLKTYLAKVEGVMDRHTQLFEDEGGNATFEDGDSIALLSGACPGILDDAPSSDLCA
ncbi:hypothetical protein K443DRAFT_12337 [Laccaria amethystina LaAM-08-1]|uniref:Uncharacterized protein n=1 Tax=Laccaria amethystina LaAM-08-1 TaxID=1095629 RepID=A0A0C9WYV4_9AGAR|nr:hypothetical protein K443DRAFT_12337 [Laccaria amethystina LaAM-08-1]